MSKYQILNSAGITAAIGLASLPAFLTLAPLVSGNPAHAEVTETLGASATIHSTLGLSTNSVSININPSSSGAVFKTGKTTATVSTNNETGYTLYLADSDSDNALNHANLDTSITSTASALTGTNMLANTWGYTLGASEEETESEVDNATNLALTYSPIPTDRVTLKRTDAAVSIESTPITFGIKVNTEIPSGVYSDRVSITAIPNYNTTAYEGQTLWLGKDGNPITTMQEMTGDICASVPTPSALATGANVPEITLTDTRDGNSYKVRKLADGNCWMAQSLAIENRTGDNKLTPADSNVTEDFELPAAIPAADTPTTDTEATISNNGRYDTYLYNWFAATAGTGTASLKNTDASGDICPKGWQLPNAYGDMSWNKLLRVGQGVYEISTSDNKYSTDKVSWGSYANVSSETLNPLGLQPTNNVWNSTLGDPANGHYWTRRATSSADSAYLMLTQRNNISTVHFSTKDGGRAIRCVAKNPVTPATATYMQDVNSCPTSLPEGQQYTLKDYRDNKEYTVAKLADGNCWMTQNLNLAGGTTLTSADSNVTQDRSIPDSSTDGFSNNNAAYIHNTPDPDANKYGGYYSWKAATAGTAGADIASGDASEDICPKNWRLPKKTEFDSLKSTTGWAKAMDWVAAPFNGVLAGNCNDGALTNVGSLGFYWSSTVNDASSTYRLHFTSSGAGTDYANKKNGLSVRCVFGF